MNCPHCGNYPLSPQEKIIFDVLGDKSLPTTAITVSSKLKHKHALAILIELRKAGVVKSVKYGKEAVWSKKVGAPDYWLLFKEHIVTGPYTLTIGNKLPIIKFDFDKLEKELRENNDG